MRPSLFDIQVNGFAGVNFQQADLTLAELRRAVAALAAHATLRFFPTLITDNIPALEQKLACLEQARATDDAVADAVCGYHLEGPWLSPEPGYRWAQDPALMRTPDAEAECARYAYLLTEAPIDLVCMGIGENGHIAFNDPPVANFLDPLAVKVVKLDDTCPTSILCTHASATLYLDRDSASLIPTGK